jgi:hypothetical protein
MARDVSPLRPARPGVRLHDLDRLALILYTEALETYVAYLTEEKAKTNR